MSNIGRVATITTIAPITTNAKRTIAKNASLESPKELIIVAIPSAIIHLS
jgi:hypothetical protein